MKILSKLRTRLRQQAAQPKSQESTSSDQPEKRWRDRLDLQSLATKWTFRYIPSKSPAMTAEEAEEIKQKLKPGDIVLSHHRSLPNLAHLEYWVSGTSYTHCGLYEGNDSVIETSGKVSANPLFMKLQGPLEVAIVRPNYKSEDDIKKVIENARGYIGTEYDYRFDNDCDKEIYCTELIEKAMVKVDPDLEVPDIEFFGKEITAPDGFLDMKGAELIHGDRGSYWSNLTGQWPYYLSSAVGAIAGGLVAGPLGGAIAAPVAFNAALWAKKKLR